MNLNKVLILIRHVSGSGSSTLGGFLVNKIDGKQYEADHWMKEDEKYVFDAKKLGYCHKQCFDSTKNSMIENCPFIVVNNTFCTERELEPYIKLCQAYEYIYFVIVLENRANTKNIHQVSELTIQKQSEKLKQSIKLI